MDTLIIDRPDPSKAIAHYFELPLTEKTIAYFHDACKEFPVKETWIAAIHAGNYRTWPGLSVKAVEKCFPESDETQQGHMKGLRQGLRSTKEKVAMENDKHPKVAMKKEHDVYVEVLD